MATPPLDVATFIAGNIAGVTLGVNVFHGIERGIASGIPADAVFCAGGAGGSPDRVQSLRYEVRRPMVHVRARARTDAQAQTWARAIHDLFQNARPAGYLDARVLQSEPTPAAESTSHLIRYTQTIELTYERDASA